MALTIDNLTNLKIFAGISSERLSAILPFFKTKAFAKGQNIVSEGDQEQVIYFINSGVVKIFKTSSEGKEQIIGIIKPGESFNEVMILGSGTSPYSAQALSLVTNTMWIHKNDILPFIEKNWSIAVNTFNILAQQQRELLILIEDLSFKNVTGRVAKILLQNAIPGPDGFQRLTQYEMAAMAGTAREVVGRSLKNLEDSGVIELERHKIVIKNKEMLKQLAGVN
jgi:CRP-like cAMP-binding protein